MVSYNKTRVLVYFPLGFYMYTEASSPRSRGDKARLISPTNPATTGSCLEFWYHMYGTDIGTLNVYARVGNTLPTRALWSENGNQGNVWKIARTTISNTQAFEVGLPLSHSVPR